MLQHIEGKEWKLLHNI